MRSPEEQERFLAHERFGELSEAQRRRRRFRNKVLTIGCLSIPVAFCLLIGIGSLGAHFLKTIATGRHTLASNASWDYGYSIEKYRWQTSGLRVRLWVGDSLDLRFKPPDFELKAIKSQRWLADNRAILIGIDGIQGFGSDAIPTEFWIFYDFERGELRSCGSPWLVWPSQQGKGRQMSCDELQAYARSLK